MTQDQKITGTVENVRVVVRVRPMDKNELTVGARDVISLDKITHSLTIVNPHAMANEPSKIYYFDNVFDGSSNQLDIYVDTARPIVNKVLEGYNGTILAYGQTGTGKTYTMIGNPDFPQTKGIIPNAFAHIFGHIAKAKGNQKFLVRVSYMEIYNQEVRDLLGKDLGKSLEVKERPDIGVFVKDLTTYVVHNADDLANIMRSGNKNRAIGSTKMNQNSSRSHAIFSITVERSELAVKHVRMGKLQLVDLAGSERQSKTQASGQRLKEATKINLSLSVLGNVISALVDGKSTHIPYRNSKLTRLLQDSLGGNSKTLMCATISPADSNYVETISTLRYASRTKNIQNRMHINEEPKDALLRHFQEEIARLRKQLEEGRRLEEISNSTEEDNTFDDEWESPVEIEMEALIVKKNFITKKELGLCKTQNLKEIDIARVEQEKLRNKLVSLEEKILVGGENLLEKAQTQEKLIEQSITELEKHEKSEEALKQTLQERASEKIDIEEQYLTLQDANHGITKKVNRVMKMLTGVKSELADQQQEHQREKEGIFENIRSLSRELALCELVLNSYVPKEIQFLINQNTHWDEANGEWQLKFEKYAGNKVKKDNSDKSNHEEFDFPNLSNVYLRYNTDGVIKSAKRRISGVPRPIARRN
ncbi:kinesin-like protein KIF3A [Drosophila eugracilis]|uniref:kinesin-like protein KIF3A n=1 Tax=Drosophila eugracilis TaxID=29029 RepID=UPI001BDA50E9|nr:kinesin-like protein KIF3A [Drosophila eugracilis]